VSPQQEHQATGLMQRAQEGDEDAYVELLVLLTKVTRRYVYLKMGTIVSWADDVVQDTLISVHAARHTYDPRRPFAPWYYAIARNRLIDGLRREGRVSQREIGVEILPDVGVTAAAEEMALAEVDIDAVRAALRTLPPRQREIVESLKLRDESVREVANRLSMSPSAVKVTAHRGYRALKRLLGVEREA
jgi:RNA polymerase sigma-70 factor (ECF subfamily)